MKKQVYVLATILIIFFAFYSVYYYSNYRVRNFPIIGLITDYKSSQIVRDPTADSLGEKNLLFSPCLDLATRKVTKEEAGFTLDTPNNKKHWLPKSNLPNKHCIFLKGMFSDTTSNAIQKLQTRWFSDNFKVNFDLNKGQHFLFSHFYHLVIFKNQLRHYKPGLVFGNDTVKAVHRFGNKNEQAQQSIKRYGSAHKPIITIQSKDFGKLVLAEPDIKKSLYSAFQSINQTIKRKEGMTLKANDHFVIPLLDFHLTQKVPSIAKEGQKTYKGVQKISLTMNAEFSALNKPMEPNDPNEIIFDEPFLIYHKKEKAQKADLIAWISNPEVLLNKGRKQ